MMKQIFKEPNSMKLVLKATGRLEGMTNNVNSGRPHGFYTPEIQAWDSIEGGSE